MSMSSTALRSVRGLTCSTLLSSSACSCSYSASAVHSTPHQPRTQPQNYNQFSVKPSSLNHERLVNHTPDFVESSALLKSLLQLAGYYSRKSDLAEGAAVLYDAITELLENERMYEVFGLEKSNFMSSYSILSLHVWVAISRLRGEGPDAKFVMQQMYDTFQKDVERRVYKAGVEIHLKKWVKKLEGIFYGTSIAYDKALRGEGSTLPDALLKNVYNNDISHKQHADLLATYLLRELECMQLTPLEDVLKGQLQFSAERLL